MQSEEEEQKDCLWNVRQTKYVVPLQMKSVCRNSVAISGWYYQHEALKSRKHCFEGLSIIKTKHFKHFGYFVVCISLPIWASHLSFINGLSNVFDYDYSSDAWRKTLYTKSYWNLWSLFVPINWPFVWIQLMCIACCAMCVRNFIWKFQANVACSLIHWSNWND